MAFSNYVMGRKSLREGADIQLTKMLAGPIHTLGPSFGT
jgi:hypothetical protein